MRHGSRCGARKAQERRGHIAVLLRQVADGSSVDRRLATGSGLAYGACRSRSWSQPSEGSEIEIAGGAPEVAQFVNRAAIASSSRSITPSGDAQQRSAAARVGDEWDDVGHGRLQVHVPPNGSSSSWRVARRAVATAPSRSGSPPSTSPAQAGTAAPRGRLPLGCDAGMRWGGGDDRWAGE